MSRTHNPPITVRLLPKYMYVYTLCLPLFSGPAIACSVEKRYPGSSPSYSGEGPGYEATVHLMT